MNIPVPPLYNCKILFVNRDQTIHSVFIWILGMKNEPTVGPLQRKLFLWHLNISVLEPPFEADGDHVISERWA